MSDEWFGCNLPKTERTIHREHRQEDNNEDVDKIEVANSEIILFFVQRFQYCLQLRYLGAVGATG
jgi:hypothetical protein